MIFATRDVTEVDEFFITNFMRTTNSKNYIPDCEEFRKEFRHMVESQFEHDLYNKSFGGEDTFSDSVTLEDRVNSWLSIIKWLGGPIPNNVFDYSFDEMLELKHRDF